MELTPQQRKEKLRKIAEVEGFEKVMDMLEQAISECISPGICLICDGVTSNHEPAARKNYCELCGANAVIAAPVLAGVI